MESSKKQSHANRRPFEKFAFVTVQASEPPNVLTEKARRDLVRSHARRTALEKARLHTGQDGDAAIEESAVPGLGYMSKFKVSRPIAKTRRLLKARPGKENAGGRTSSVTETDLRHHEGTTLDVKGYPLTVKSRPRPSLQTMQHNGLIDPFESLPVFLGPKQRMLLHYHSNYLQKSFIAFDPTNQFLSQANSDPAWMNAAFSLVALHHDLRVGRGLSPECWHHRGEALRLVNAQLSDKTLHLIKDSTVGAVAALVNFDITAGFSANATMHMDGLQQMVNLQGGLQALKHNQLLQNLISWSDLLYSSAFDSRPRFTFGCNTFNISVTPICANDHRIFQEHLSCPPGFNAKMRETVRILRNLSRQRSTVSFSANKQCASNLVERVQFSNCLYLAEYRLLTLFNDAESTLLSMRLRKPWQLGAYLYLHLVLRELPVASEIEYNLVKRLKATLEETPNLYELWTENINLLLWIMFISAVAAAERVERSYFIEQIMMTTNQEGILSISDFVISLKSVMWLEDFCGPHAVAVWNEVKLIL